VHDDDALTEALGDSQRLGMLGDLPIADVVRHARQFVSAIRTLEIDAPRVADIGSGGGVPGLVVAHDLPHARVTLIDRRAKRTDHLGRLAGRLGLSGRVEIICADLRRAPTRLLGAFDVVTARGFGPPEITVSLGSGLVRSGGWLLISEPPSGDRWQPGWLAEHGLERRSAPAQPIVVMQRV